MPEPVTSRTKTSPIWEVVLAGIVGSIMEWYDFTLYGIAAALVFNDLFFPKLDAAAATLASFSTLALGFVARPLGGIILGNLGDRVGRTQARSFPTP